MERKVTDSFLSLPFPVALIMIVAFEVDIVGFVVSVSEYNNDGTRNVT